MLSGEPAPVANRATRRVIQALPRFLWLSHIGSVSFSKLPHALDVVFLASGLVQSEVRLQSVPVVLAALHDLIPAPEPLNKSLHVWIRKADREYK